MVSYLQWLPGGPSQVTAVTPFTYRDGLTYLEKLELIGSKVNEVIDVANAAVDKEVLDITRIDGQYAQLVADWNATLARLDPTQVRAIVSGYDSQIASLGTRVTATESKNTAQDTVLAGKVDTSTYTSGMAAKADKTYVDAQDTSTLNSSKAYTDTAKAAANTYTDGKVSALSTVYETQAALGGDVDARVISNLGSATAMRGAFDSRYAAAGSVAFPVTGKNGGFYYLSAYCNAAQKAGTASASPAIAQIMTEMSAANSGKNVGSMTASGGTIIVDGFYMVDSPIVPKSGMAFIGTGTRSSGFYLTSGNLFQLGSGQYCEGFLCDNFCVEIASTGGSFLSMTGTDGNNESILTKATFRSLRIKTLSTSKEIVSVTGYSEYHANQWFGFEMDRPTASTVGLFKFKSNAGNVMNSNSIRGAWLHGHNSTGAPAIIVNSSAAGWQHNWTFEDLCGEQNCAGLISVGGVNHVQIRNCVDWDGVVNYTGAVIAVGPNAGGTYSCNVGVESSGLATNDAVVGVAVNVANGTLNSWINGCDAVGQGGKVIAGNYTRVDGKKRAWKGTDVSYTATLLDHVIMAGTAGITITLPDPLTMPNIVQEYQVLNISGGAVTIAAVNGRTVNGAASYSLAAGSSITLTTEGQYKSASGAAMRWIRVAG